MAHRWRGMAQLSGEVSCPIGGAATAVTTLWAVPRFRLTPDLVKGISERDNFDVPRGTVKGIGRDMEARMCVCPNCGDYSLRNSGPGECSECGGEMRWATEWEACDGCQNERRFDIAHTCELAR
jgi:hypothetical protein